jgi:hypothetical protein
MNYHVINQLTSIFTVVHDKYSCISCTGYTEWNTSVEHDERIGNDLVFGTGPQREKFGKLNI